MIASDRPLVMVSSVVEGFAEFREAARRGIEAAGGVPLLVNEDFASQAQSSRNVCLDAVASSDIYLVIVAERGGWETPSGKLATEEEYEEALRRKKPVLVFLGPGPRDAKAERFASRLSQYTTGHFRESFSTPIELEAAITKALASQFRTQTLPMTDATYLSALFQQPSLLGQAPTCRFVLVPSRQEEVIDPVALGSDTLRNQLLQLGHDGSVQLLSFAYGCDAEIRGDALVIRQSDHHSVKTHVSVHENGLIAIDTVIETERPAHDFTASFVIAEEDIERRLIQSFSFSRGFLETQDPFGRHQTFLFNCSILNIGYRHIERNPAPRSGGSMSLRGDQPLHAYDNARQITRSDVHDPSAEVTRAITLLVRKSK